ncbi:MAG: hypothetical protein MI892_12930, partial [Desulfobacterales bacterium]|nr:hypothetical protein [Desulfobacterales bacterium]
TVGGSERMRIDSLGNVGIGTLNPSTKLEVNGSGAFNSNLILREATLNNFVIEHLKDSGDLYLRSFHANDSSGNLLLNDLGGNVGIGTDTPSEKLDVEGNVLIDGNLTIKTGAESRKFYVSRLGGVDQAMQMYATDRDFYMIYLEDSIEALPGEWHFINAVDNGSSYEFMTAQTDGDVVFNGGGNVGIGIMDPSERFHVSGGNITLSNSTVDEINYFKFGRGGYMYDNGSALIFGYD